VIQRIAAGDRAEVTALECSRARRVRRVSRAAACEKSRQEEERRRTVI
jgi:hypothetical protein